MFRLARARLRRGSLKPTVQGILLNPTLWRWLILLAAIIVPSVYFAITLPKESHERHKNVHRTLDRVHESLAPIPQTYRANATLMMLCRNSELKGVLSSVRQVEDRFNGKFRYPWVFLNDEPFEDEFKRRVKNIIPGEVHFGLVPADHWNQPSWINETLATEGRNWMVSKGVVYGASVAYRNMCRWNSGFFYKHPIMMNYRYYWRIEPDVDYFCDLNYDPFTYMEVNNKIYGFTLALHEWKETVKSLWGVVNEFIDENPTLVHPRASIPFISENGMKDYNWCHFWSNFEIADMDWYRGPVYTKFFEFLDSKGGFYYERWGDAPVHSIAVSLLAAKEQVHYFYDIGYRHDIFYHCPGGKVWDANSCSCPRARSFNNRQHSCVSKWLAQQDTLY